MKSEVVVLLATKKKEERGGGEEVKEQRVWGKAKILPALPSIKISVLVQFFEQLNTLLVSEAPHNSKNKTV